MVGRENELKELQEHLSKVSQGQGSTLFISGEAGIGKTRLVNELKKIAQSEGFQILSGNSLYESLTPYMPFLEALRSGGLESLFAEEAPRVEAVYLVTNTGLLIKEVVRRETELDPDIFASMLTTVGDFVKDSLAMLDVEETHDTLNRLGYGDHTILLESGRTSNIAVIVAGRENEFLINDMKEVLVVVDKNYGKILEDWDGDEEKVKGVVESLQPLITSGMYDGIYYGKENPRARRNLLFENVSLGMMRQAETTPTMLCMEDLQWADPSTLALMHYLARNTRQCRLLILGTYRPEDVAAKEGKTHPLVDTMQLMSREDLYDKMELGRLSEGSISDFMSSPLGAIDFGDDFMNRIFRESEGNPLFMTEIVKLLLSEGAIKAEEETWKLARDLEEIEIPSKIYNVIVRRLNRVGKGEREILDRASVLGETFTSAVLADTLGIERIRLLEQLRTLEQNHGLIHSRDGDYRFDHSKIKEVLYSEIPTELAVEYHAVIAGSIEEINKDHLEEVVGDLAFHYHRCKNREKALLYLEKAAEKAKKEYSNEEAIRLYSNALELEEDREKRMEILEALGVIHNLIGEYDESIDSFKNALEFAGQVRKKAEIMAEIGGAHRMKGEYDESIGICTEALHLVEGMQCKEEAVIFDNVGTVHYHEGQYDKALEEYERSLGIREEIGDQLGIANSLNNIGNVHYRKGQYDKALEEYERSLGIREEVGDQQAVALSLGNIGNMYRVGEEFAKALEYYDKSLMIFAKIGDQRGTSISLHNVGVLHWARGENDKALEHHKKSLNIRERIGHRRGMGSSHLTIGDVLRAKGDYDGALKHYETSLEILETVGDQRVIAYDYSGIAEVYLERGDLTKALDFCKRAFDLSKEFGLKMNLAYSGRIFGKIYGMQRHWKESIENFEESIRGFQEIKNEKDLANSHYEFGLMRKAKGDPGNAKEQLDSARELYEKMNLKRELEKVREALSDL
jgi:tetratricopeptide (TPR) repeat protein/predicted regulator of Ras-like GTPase activity (Roadblock/LC7/MglB family)